MSNKLPSWQIAQKSANAEGNSHASPDKSTTLSRASLIGQASKFLEDRDVKQASREQKRNFLRDKGLTEGEVSELLEKRDNVNSPDEALAEEDVDNNPNSVEGAVGSPQASNMDIMDDYIDIEPLARPEEDRPPIITYPEFLLHSQKPPPVITTRRLVTTFYLASGTAATIYGLSKYVVEPMFDSLTLVRHSFFESASSNIDQLNEKLENAVSKIPTTANELEEKEISDDDSLSSDPSHFFSRTIATQTSPHLSRSTSSTSLEKRGPMPTTETHADEITKINNLLSELNHTGTDMSDPIKENFRSLREYFADLPMLGRTGQFERAKQAGLKSDQKLDGVANVKAEIKSVKGALLSARNFPAGNTSR